MNPNSHSNKDFKIIYQKNQNVYNQKKSQVSTMRWGHFDLGDKPKRISNIVRDRDQLMCTIQWLPRRNGF